MLKRKQGEILLIPIPFTDLSSSKKRPVLVLSNNEYNLTSNISSKNHSVFITNDDLVDGDLKVDSCIRSDKIYTLSQNIVIKRFGKINEETINKVINKISEILN